jgi:uncharacterized membrane protein
VSETLFAYRLEIIFIHVISAVVWVGGMISIRFAAHPAFMDIASPQDRLEKIAKTLKRLFILVMPFVLLLALTGAFLAIAYGTKHTSFGYLTHIKEGIWSVMFINLVMMIIRRNKAQKALESGEFASAGQYLGVIGKYMVPVNIALGVSAIAIGVLLRINL